jgi:NAD(P)H dehydrogenase (quinone)
LSDTILVTGAAGHLGRLVIGHLLDTQKIPASRIVAGTRDPSKLADLAARGVATRKVDFNDAAALPAAFAGVGTLLIISTDALDGAGTRARQHADAVAAAAKAGVGAIAYTSIPNADTSDVLFAPDHLGTETAIKATGLPYTIYRNSWYFENLFMSLPQALKSGQWFTSAGQGKTANLARADIAAAIAAGIIKKAENRIYTLTGQVGYTNDEIAALATKATGKPIAVVHLTDEQLAGGMKAAGVPEAFIPVLVSFDTATRNGGLGTVTDDATTLAGRPLVTLEAFLNASAKALLA